ncbi:MAG: 3'(2'),5'-bisphosphate nucleotidase CysQ [Acidimicrobiales bacterium]|jgi:3'(2'), 5'-bisphosphate nucleotidase
MESDVELASRLASEAGELLLGLRGAFSGDQKELANQGDTRAHHHIVSELKRLRSSDAVISEEDTEGSRPWPRPDRQWLVDPLDGSREYSENRNDFAVHVALVIGGVAKIAAVALPGDGLVLTTADEFEEPGVTEEPIRMLVSRTRPPAEATALADLLSAQLVPMGSAGAKTVAVVRGLGDVYLHAGGQYEWDSAAPVAVAVAAGMHASRIDGSPIRYGERDPWLPDLLVCRPDLTDRIFQGLETIRSSSS